MDDPDIFLDSNIELDRAMRDHPSVWRGPPRIGPRCPVCNRQLRSGEFLTYPHWRSTGSKSCGVCQRWEARLNHVEDKAPAPKGVKR